MNLAAVTTSSEISGAPREILNKKHIKLPGDSLYLYLDFLICKGHLVASYDSLL